MSLQSNVFNKVTFYRKVKETTAKQKPGTFSFLMQIQVRNFGEMQKQHGPLRTDAFCNHVNDVVAKLILGMKLTPNVVRTGDATVACLIRECDDAGAGERAALNICADARFALQVDPEHRLESPVNVGVVAVKTGDDVEALLMRADLACQTAIEKGPNTCHVHLPDAAATSKSETLATPARTPVTAKLTIDLAGIIKSNSIQPSYQPYIALSETATSVKARYYQVQLNLIVGPEQAVRAHDLHLHQVTSGNPGMLDLWVTRHMLGQLLNLEQEGEGTKCGLFIRLFPETLSQNILFNWMQDLLKKSRNPGIASTIVFELYPPDFLAHKKNFMNFINQMRDTWGVAFALYDVVNTGVLETCVKQGGFEFVKFAMEEKGMQTVAQISAQARELGALTVIQNIGSAQQLATAIELGFDYGQGEFVQPSIDNLLLGNEVITI
jgi:EAL domain-containing protein (putative c-di-GMP-specific phosphodiesterase class I)/GGDEF domain-containing protein